MAGDEATHHRDAARIVEHFDLYSSPTQQQLLTEEALVFTDDHLRDPVQQDRPTAHRARREQLSSHTASARQDEWSRTIAFKRMSRTRMQATRATFAHFPRARSEA